MKLNATNAAGRNRRGASRFEVFLIIVVILVAFDLTRRFVELSVRWTENQKRADRQAAVMPPAVAEPTNTPAAPGNAPPVMVPSVAAATAVATQNVTMPSAQYVFVAPPPNPAPPPVASAPASGGVGGGGSGRAGMDILLSPRTIQYLMPNTYITIALPIDEDDTNAPPQTTNLP